MKYRKTIEYADETVYEIAVQCEKEDRDLHELLARHGAREVEND